MGVRRKVAGDVLDSCFDLAGEFSICADDYADGAKTEHTMTTISFKPSFTNANVEK